MNRVAELKGAENRGRTARFAEEKQEKMICLQ